MPALTGIIIVIVSLAGLLGFIAWWQKKTSPHPELSRKLLHVGMGVVTLFFPWLFESPWPVISLAILATVLLYAIRALRPLSSNLGQVMGSVERKSLGEFYFPLAVAILFVLSNGQPVFYCLPILVLTASDTGAALVGTRFGAKSYTTIDGIKTAEGSITFFLITLTIISCGLFVASVMSPFQSILTALTISGLLTLLEAISWHGLDNLFVPLGSLVLLQRYLELETSDLVFRLAILLIISAVVFIRRQKTTLTGNAFLICILVAFVTWVLTDWRWLIAPVTFYLFYAKLWPDEIDSQTSHDMQAVGAITGPAMLWVLLSQYLPVIIVLFSYTYVYAAHMVVFGSNRYLQADASVGLPNRTMKVVPRCWVLFFLPYLFLSPNVSNALGQSVSGLVLLLITISILHVLFGKLIKEFTAYQRWISQSLTVGLVSFAGLLFLLQEVSL